MRSAALRRVALAGLALACASAARAQPANDSFAARINLGSVSPANGSGTNVSATKEAGEPNHGGSPGGKSVWWSWMAPANGVVTVTTSGSGFDTLLGVYTGGAVAGLTFVAGNDDTPVPYVPGTPQKTSLATFNAVSGTTYQIAVDGFFGAAGTVALSITLAAGSAPPTLSISDATVTEQDFGVTTAFFEVTLSAPTNLAVTVAYSTGGGTAVAGVDYLSVSGTLHLSPGEVGAGIEVTVLGDAAAEANDTFNVNLSLPTNAVLSDGQGVGTITNDEGLSPSSPDLLWQTGTVGASGFPGMSAINGIGFGSATHVMVGAYGDIWTSPDAVTWTRRTNPDGSLRPLRGVAFGGGTFVAVGACCSGYGGDGIAPGYGGGPILTSANGTTWTYRGELGESGLHAVAYGNGLFVAVGPRGTVIVSANAGVNWQYAAVPGLGDYLGVAFGGGAFVAVGERGSILRSSDGVSWTAVGAPGDDLRAVAHTGTQFVAVGASGTILTSPDGSTWTPRASGTNASLAGVAHAAGTLVAVGADVVLTSTDGSVWTPRARPLVVGESRSLRTVAFGTTFLAAGEDGSLSSSPNGTSWTSLTFVTSGLNRGVAFNGTTTYCAVGNAGSVASSTNGSAWGLQIGLLTRPLWHWKSVASGASLFVAVGDSAEIMSSPDCVTWTERNAGVTADPATGIAGHLSDVTFGGGSFAAVGEEVPNTGEGVALIATSPDGINWTQRAAAGLTADEHSLEAVAQGNARFVALGHNRVTGRVVSVVSTDGGATWSGQTIAAFDPYEEVHDLAFGNGLFVAVGDRIWSSPDGASWTPRRGYAAQPLRAVAFGGGRFVAAGDLGTLLGSPDASRWTVNLRPANNDLFGLVAGPAGQPELLVGVGDAIAVSSAAPTRPANDNLANAAPVAGVAFSTTGTNVFATKEAGEPSHAGSPGGRSVWWVWTAPQTGKAMFTTAGSGIDTVLAVYTGSTMATLNLIAANDDFVDFTSRVRFDAVSGTAYRIAVDGFGGSSGPITLSGGMAPVNDDFAERLVLAPGTTGSSGSNVNATKESGEPNHALGLGGRSIWWSWTPAASGMVTITTAGSLATAGGPLDTLLAVYTGNVSRACSPPAIQPPNCLTQVAANDDENFPTVPTSRVTFAVVSGTAYRIVVDGYNSASGSVTFGLTLVANPPILSIADTTVTEGNAGTAVATFTVSLNEPSNNTVTATYATGGGTATAGIDYASVPPTQVTFTVGQTSRTVSVNVSGDTTVEPDETFLVSLSNPVNATLGDAQATGTILNDDSGLSIDDVSVVELPVGTRDAIFTVTLSPPVSGIVTVQFATANGTATSPNDFTSVTGTLTFPANTPTQTVLVPVHGDSLEEATETFNVTLSSATGGASITRATGTGRIFDPGNLFTVNPCRLADTRGAEGPALAPGADRTFAVAGRCGVPATARAASVNITVTQGTEAGDLRIYPAGDAVPLASAINYVGGQTRANNAVIPLGDDGRIAVRLDQAAGSVHMILDVNGYIE